MTRSSFWTFNHAFLWQLVTIAHSNEQKILFCTDARNSWQEMRNILCSKSALYAIINLDIKTWKFGSVYKSAGYNDIY